MVCVTTGQIPCETLGPGPSQVAFSVRVGRSIASPLRTILQEWSFRGQPRMCADRQAEEEDGCVPPGRVIMDGRADHLGIEPMGAGMLLAAMWERVLALVLRLEFATAAWAHQRR